MRKRIVIGVCAVVAGFGVVAGWPSSPEKGTVEYHQQAFRLAWDRAVGLDWRSRVGNWVSDKTGVTPMFLYANEKERNRLVDEMKSHTAAVDRCIAQKAAESAE